MADVFELKGVDAVLRIRGQDYKFRDPPFGEKVLAQKAWDQLNSDESVDRNERLLRAEEINKRMVKSYLPDIPDEYLNHIGMHEMSALLDHITEITGTKFGAIVSKVDEKK